MKIQLVKVPRSMTKGLTRWYWYAMWQYRDATGTYRKQCYSKWFKKRDKDREAKVFSELVKHELVRFPEV